MPKKNWPYLLILVLSIFAVYANSLNNAFLSDDIAEIVLNPRIGDFSYIFTHPFGFIRLILNWIAYHLGGLNPLLFRSINVGFHIGCVVLIFYLLNILTQSRKLAFFVSWIFAVHPAISEAVVWISGGTYPQYTFFFLLSLFLYIKSKEIRKLYWLSPLAFLASFMSHPQMPIALFLIFPLYEYIFGNLKQNWQKSLPFLVITIAYAFINLGGLQERTTTLQSVHYQEKGIDNPFILIPVAISSYFELLLYPSTLTLYHSELAFGNLEFSIRVLFTLALIFITLISFKKNKVIFFYLALFWISLAPTLTPFRLNWIVAERYLYLPILGILTTICIGIIQLSQKFKLKGMDYALIILVVALLSVRTIARNVDWKSEDNLWIATGKTSPSSPNTHNNLGDVYGRWGNKQKAIEEFQTAILIKPNYADAYHNLANTYREVGELDKALENYHKALEFNPNLWQSYQNIAAIYFNAKQYDKTLDYIQKAIQINPKNINLVNNLGVVYLAMGEKEKAKEIFTKVLAANPQNQFARQALFEISK